MKLALAVVLLLSGVAQADDPPRQLHQVLLQHFDRNHDGRLEPRERRHAAKVLRRLIRQERKRAFIRRFDLDHDGNIGPGELPPALADQLRPLDRNGDGWLTGNELP